MESQFHAVVFFYFTIDTRVNFDWAKTIIVTFVLKLPTAKVCPRPHSHEGDLSGQMWKRIKSYPYSSVAFRCNPEK